MKPIRAFFATFAMGLAALSASHVMLSGDSVPDPQLGPIPPGVAIA